MITRRYFYYGRIAKSESRFSGIISTKSLFPDPVEAYENIIANETEDFKVTEYNVIIDTFNRV